MASFYIELPPPGGGGGGAVSSVNGLTGVVVLTKSNIGLANVNNTSDANKPISTATQTALNLKQDAGAQVIIPDGSATVPGLRLTTDNDTGLFQVGDGNLSISANGSRKLSIDQSEITTDVTLHVQGDLNVDGNFTAANFPQTGSANTFAGFDGSGNLFSIPGFNIDTNSDGMNEQLTEQPNNLGGGTVNTLNVTFDPLQNSPNESWNIVSNYANIDPNSTGFTIGTAGNSLRFISNNAYHHGTSDIGSIELINNNFDIGNGTDPIDVKGIAYAMGFGQIANNVNMSGPIQGYGFQPNVASGATIINATSTQAFYDGSNIGCPSPNYTIFNGSPTIASIQNNSNFSGLQINPNISGFTGNAGATAISVSGNYGAFGTGGFNGIYVNPTATNVNSAYGLFVDVQNIAVYPGVVSSLIIQDLTIAADVPSSFTNGVTIEYTPGATAGSEVVSNIGLAYTVQIDSGVSTATQIAAALNGNVGFALNFNVTISGVGSNAQVTQAATNLAGGFDPGNKRAAYFNGNVEIIGSLAFSGALSIGQLNAFAILPIVDAGGNPTSIHSLVSASTVAANATIANGDTLGINTAMLLTMGDNSTVTTSFVGVAALALPAVISMGAGSTIDQVSGATFAVSLDGGATGGTIDNLDLARSIAIPNGVTTITTLSGFKFDLPFGDPGTTTWGFYESPGVNNYFAGNLLIGGTAYSDDTVTNSSVALEIKSTTKAFMNARMTTTQKNALTAVAGMQVYDSTLNQLSYYNGTTWVNI